MEYYNHPSFAGHEKVVCVYDRETGLKALIAVHDTAVGPGLGGMRIRGYENEGEALDDVLRLSEGMSYKSAMAGMPLGGGKAVIVNKPEEITDEMVAAFGRAVNDLGGKYVTAEDMGTSEEMMDIISKQTQHVCGLKGSKISGDPSPFTAKGVFISLKSGVKAATGSEDLTGVKVALQGVGNVGFGLAKLLHEAGAEIIASDPNQEHIDRLKNEIPGATIVGLDEIYDQKVDVFAPNAIGATLNGDTLPRLKKAGVKVIAGAANNQLQNMERHGKMVDTLDIVYVPDFVANAGGVIAAGAEYLQKVNHPDFRAATRESVLKHIDEIGPKVDKVLEMAREQKIDATSAAKQMAQDIIKEAREKSTQQDNVKSRIAGENGIPKIGSGGVYHG